MNIKIDNDVPSLFIQVIGGHAVGKSSIVGKMKTKFGAKIKVLGRYRESPTHKGLLTGGMDGVQLTNTERFDIIKNAFLSNNKVIICEGMMVSYYGSFISKYSDLQKERNRKIWIICLEADKDVIFSRVFNRSDGKQMNPKREKNITNKMSLAKSVFEKLEETDMIKKVMFTTNTIDEINEVAQFITKLIEEVI